MDLHQIQVTYQEVDDRILVRTTFTQPKGAPLEIRSWFTRRFVQILWPGITTAMQAQVLLNQPHMGHASAEMISMENQVALSEIKTQGNFDEPMASVDRLYPLGELPILVDNVKFTLDAHKPVLIHFTDTNNTGVELSFTPVLLHGFCSLLQKAVKTANWGIDLQLPATALTDDAPRVLN